MSKMGCKTSFFKRKTWKHPLHSDLTCQDVYEKTLDKKRLLQERGYKVRIMWDCELKHLLATKPDMQQFFNDDLGDIHFDDPLMPRYERLIP